MDQVGGYRLVALLGEGGMGRVHLGRAASGRLVAVKTVREHLAADPLFRERFRREAAAARSVAGPFTAAVLDADPEAVRPWLATEFCTGPTLTGAVSALGPPAPGELAALGAALAEAVAAVHAAGLVHRDLKPSNVVVTRDGPMVIDFGIARAAAEESLTGSGEIVGSPGFIAPELLTGAGEPGPAVDVFALGALLAYAATGHPPFGTGPVHQVLYRTTHGVPDLGGVPAGGPDAAYGWRELLGACLSREPGDRPTVAEVLSTCAGWTDGDPWWEREAMTGLIRRREEEIAALVAEAPPGTPSNTPDVPDESGVSEESDEAPAPGAADVTTTRAVAGAKSGTAVSGGRGADRRRFLRWGGAALAGAAAAGTVAWLASLTGNGDADGAESGASASPGPYARGRVLWTRDTGGARPLRHGGALYLVGTGALTRLDARSGAVVWSHRTDDITEAVPGPELVHVLRVSPYVGASVTTLDAANGAVRWSAETVRRNPRRPPELLGFGSDDMGDGTEGAFSVAAGVLCLVTYSSYATAWHRRTAPGATWRAYGYDARTGDALWFHQGGKAGVVGMHQAGGRIAVATARTSFSADGEENGEPLAVLRAADGTPERAIPGGSRRPEAHPGSRGVHHYAARGRLSAVDLATRRTLWSREPDGEADDVTITPAAVAGLVHSGTYDTLSALDAKTGRTRWSVTGVGPPEDGVPLVSGGLVYGVGRAPEGEETPDGRPAWGVHARNAATGALVWAAETGPATAVVTGPDPADSGEDADGESAESGGREGTAGAGLVHVSVDGVLSTFAAPEVRA
ncbi:PQQ-binding-like beta-propeller repeat protein [Streptomyces sp. NBC_01498]|uniref:protein kinase domain-containing protein n=1 Tax=Streptomyces sp. NBC_01498 TaxID=2975870 RepID=UPI002E7BE214|nr:protein kinase [Streptomyces sp. NBC_01498]WTL27480.1 PQQ-binding-like beta-propeller repeat protein [Streptomyces sp. NBC_01498]